MNGKKILIGILSLLLVSLFSACKGEVKIESSSETSQATEVTSTKSKDEVDSEKDDDTTNILKYLIRCYCSTICIRRRYFAEGPGRPESPVDSAESKSLQNC